MDRIYTEGLKFRDEKGRECIFNGINLVKRESRQSSDTENTNSNGMKKP